MPRHTDLTTIRAILETDRAWSLYALGDLAPGYRERAEWHLSADGRALALIYRPPQAAPVLFTLGPAESVAPLLDEIRRGESQTRPYYISIRPEILPLIKCAGEREARPYWAVRDETPMWRMTVDSTHFCPQASSARRLHPADLLALQTLFADGEASHEAPDFFFPEMLSEGVFFGIEERGALLAAAGTHLVSVEMGVGAIGNVYTRRDQRGRGLAAQTTSAVTAELLRMNIATIGLNVKQSNAAAQSAYARLGFARYGAFYEGVAERR